MGLTCFLLAGAPVFPTITDLAFVLAHYQMDPVEALTKAVEVGALYEAEDTVEIKGKTGIFGGGAFLITLDDGSQIVALKRGVKCNE